MTTIAYKDGVIACDSKITSSNGIAVAQIKKIFTGKNGIAGISGNLADVKKLKAWIKSGSDKLPNFSNNSSVIFISKRGRLSLIEFGEIIPIKTKFIASGSGEEIAMGAMMAGKSAKQAVRIACKLDNGSGGKIHTIKLQEYAK